MERSPNLRSHLPPESRNETDVASRPRRVAQFVLDLVHPHKEAVVSEGELDKIITRRIAQITAAKAMNDRPTQIKRARRDGYSFIGHSASGSSGSSR